MDLARCVGCDRNLAQACFYEDRSIYQGPTLLCVYCQAELQVERAGLAREIHDNRKFSIFVERLEKAQTLLAPDEGMRGPIGAWLQDWFAKWANSAKNSDRTVPLSFKDDFDQWSRDWVEEFFNVESPNAKTPKSPARPNNKSDMIRSIPSTIPANEAVLDTQDQQEVDTSRQAQVGGSEFPKDKLKTISPHSTPHQTSTNTGEYRQCAVLGCGPHHVAYMQNTWGKEHKTCLRHRILQNLKTKETSRRNKYKNLSTSQITAWNQIEAVETLDRWKEAHGHIRPYPLKAQDEADLREEIRNFGHSLPITKDATKPSEDTTTARETSQGAEKMQNVAHLPATPTNRCTRCETFAADYHFYAPDRYVRATACIHCRAYEHFWNKASKFDEKNESRLREQVRNSREHGTLVDECFRGPFDASIFGFLSLWRKSMARAGIKIPKEFKIDLNRWANDQVDGLFGPKQAREGKLDSVVAMKRRVGNDDASIFPAIEPTMDSEPGSIVRRPRKRRDLFSLPLSSDNADSTSGDKSHGRDRDGS